MSTSQQWPSVDDVVHYLQRNRSASPPDILLPGLALFGTGLLVGAGLALLFAPATGQDLRHDIGERIGDLTERIIGEGEENSTADRPSA